MSIKIDAREVLKCLNELGYINITAQQLKEFMKDLKKLMKYEDRLEKSRSGMSLSNDRGETSNLSSVKSSIDEHSFVDTKNDVFSYLYSKETIASEAKKTKTKESVISVQVKRPSTAMQKSYHHSHCIHDTLLTEETEATPGRSRSESDIEITQKISKSDTDVLGHTTLNSNIRLNSSATEVSRDTIDDDRPRVFRKCCKSTVGLKPKTSFIRPRMSKTFKTDPVALYHQYQEEWKRQKCPGEDGRADLRWAIREKMLGDPRVCGNSISGILKQRRNNPWQA